MYEKMVERLAELREMAEFAHGQWWQAILDELPKEQIDFLRFIDDMLAESVKREQKDLEEICNRLPEDAEFMTPEAKRFRQAYQLAGAYDGTQMLAKEVEEKIAATGGPAGDVERFCLGAARVLQTEFSDEALKNNLRLFGVPGPESNPDPDGSETGAGSESE